MSSHGVKFAINTISSLCLFNNHSTTGTRQRSEPIMLIRLHDDNSFGQSVMSDNYRNYCDPGYFSLTPKTETMS